MIKKFFRFILILLCLFLGLLIAFYYWGSSPTFSNDKYVINKSYSVPNSDMKDSVFTIVTYNIGYLSGMNNLKPVLLEQDFFYKNLALVIQSFKEIKPHIVAYQEIDFGGDRSHDLNQSDKIAQNCGFSYQLDAVNWDKTYVPFPYSWDLRHHFGQVYSGQAIHSRFQMLSHERLVLEPNTHLPFYQKAFYTQRLAQVARLKIQNKEVVVINVHLEAFDAPTRIRQGKVIKELFERYAKYYPVILLGDFNSNAPTPANRQNSDYEAVIDDLLKVSQLKSAIQPENFGKQEYLTFSSQTPEKQIDYIFYSADKIECIESRVIKEVKTASDHLPVMMKFKFK
jgi:endonuclease/exonuclease/phosphatase family metal-dependent hydrolase